MATENVRIVYETNLDSYRKDLDALVKKNDELEKEIEQVAQATKKQQKAQGNLSASIGSTIKRYVAWGAVIMQVRKLFMNATRTVKDFDQSQANLASILGKSRKEITQLTEDAKRLGATTAFTASQVASLQTEYAKLGFSQSEILNATEATLSLAAATKTDLSQAAAVAGATVRGFNLNASETQRVVDVMAASFSQSALDMEKFTVGMRSVAPVADSAGVSVERTTALLGVLTNRGVDASTAGTSLRNIFLELSKRGLTWEEAMEKINNASDKNATALELFGKRGSTAGTILAGAAGEADALTASLERAGGTAQDMADKQLDTLIGDTIKLQSAWEGLVLSIEDGSGPLSNASRWFTQMTTQAAQLTTHLNEGNLSFKQWAGAILSPNKQVREWMINVAGRVEEGKRLEEQIAREIKQQEEYEAALEKGNVTYEQKVLRLERIRKQMKDMDPESKARTELLAEEAQLQKEVNREQEMANQVMIENSETINSLKETVSELKQELGDAAIGSEHFNEVQKQLTEAEEKLAKATGKVTEEQKKRQKAYEDFLKQQDTLIKQNEKLIEQEFQNLIAEEEKRRIAALPENNKADTSIEMDFEEEDTIDPEAIITDNSLAALEEKKARLENSLRFADPDSLGYDAIVDTLENVKKQIEDFGKDGDGGFNWDGMIESAAESFATMADLYTGVMASMTEAELNRINLTENRELESLQQRLNEGLITQQEYETQKLAIEEEAEKKRAAEQKKRFMRERAIAIAKLTIEGILMGIAGNVAGAIQAAAGIAAILATPVPQFAEGVIGLRGPGTETSDSILARLSKGESVITAKGTRKHKDLLTAINADNDNMINQILSAQYALSTMSKDDPSITINSNFDKEAMKLKRTMDRNTIKEMEQRFEIARAQMKLMKRKNRSFYA